MSKGPLKATQQFGLKTNHIIPVSTIPHSSRKTKKYTNNRRSPDIIHTTKAEKCYQTAFGNRSSACTGAMGSGASAYGGIGGSIGGGRGLASSEMKRANSLDRGHPLTGPYLNSQWPLPFTNDRATQTDSCEYISNVNIQHARSSSHGEKMLFSRVKTKLRSSETNKVKYITKRSIATHVSKKRQNGSSEALNQELENLNLKSNSPISSHRLDGRKAPILEFLRGKKTEAITQTQLPIRHNIIKTERNICDDSSDSSNTSNTSHEKDSKIFVRSPPDGCDVIKVEDESSYNKNPYHFCPIQNEVLKLKKDYIPRIPSKKSAFIPR